jgi:hypothetical protein
MLQRGIRMFRLPPKSIQIKRSTAPFGGLRGNLTLQVYGRIVRRQLTWPVDDN